MIEINARPGLWNKSALASGVNLPYILYCDTLGIKHTYKKKSDKEIVWVNTFSDFYHFIIEKRKEKKISYWGSLKEWFFSIKGKKVNAIWSMADPYPFFWGIGYGISRFLLKRQ